MLPTIPGSKSAADNDSAATGHQNMLLAGTSESSARSPAILPGAYQLGTSLTREEEEDVREVFDIFDSDRDGRLDLQELQASSCWVFNGCTRTTQICIYAWLDSNTDANSGVYWHHVRCQSAFRALGLTCSADELQQMLSQLAQRTDRPTSTVDYVSSEDFRHLATSCLLQRPDDYFARAAYRLFAGHGKDGISADDIQRVACELGQPLDEDEVARMISEFDANGDGQVSEAEFLGIMSGSSR